MLKHQNNMVKYEKSRCHWLCVLAYAVNDTVHHMIYDRIIYRRHTANDDIAMPIRVSGFQMVSDSGRNRNPCVRLGPGDPGPASSLAQVRVRLGRKAAPRRGSLRLLTGVAHLLARGPD